MKKHILLFAFLILGLTNSYAQGTWYPFMDSAITTNKTVKKILINWNTGIGMHPYEDFSLSVVGKGLFHGLHVNGLTNTASLQVNQDANFHGFTGFDRIATFHKGANLHWLRSDTGMQVGGTATFQNITANGLLTGTVMKLNTLLETQKINILGLTTTNTLNVTDRVEITNSLDAATIRTDNLILSTNSFPDYVFSKDYNLMSLKEVSDFVSKNHHLPNMPSEKEVVENGMSIGQINKVLVEKVEELTLYTIEQENKINQLIKEINSIKSSLKL